MSRARRQFGLFLLRNNRPVPCTRVLRWARAAARNRQNGKWTVAQDKVQGYTVATIFLGVDYSFGVGTPELFESMISNGVHRRFIRYATWWQAARGHRQLVRSLEAQNADDILSRIA